MTVREDPARSGQLAPGETMNTTIAKAAKWLGKAGLAAVALGGFLALFGAQAASARPYCYERPRFHAVVVAPGYYGYYRPRAAYAGPVYRPYRRHVEYRYWDARFHCWRYR